MIKLDCVSCGKPLTRYETILGLHERCLSMQAQLNYECDTWRKEVFDGKREVKLADLLHPNPYIRIYAKKHLEGDM